MHNNNGNSWMSKHRGLPSCAAPQHTAQHSLVRSSAHHIGEAEVSSSSTPSNLPSCMTPQHSHHWHNAPLGDSQAEASSASVQAVPSCATPQHSHRWHNASLLEEIQKPRSSARKRSGEESMGEATSDYKRRREEMEGHDMVDSSNAEGLTEQHLRTVLTAQEAAVEATQRALQECTAAGRAEGLVSQGQGRFTLGSSGPRSYGRELHRSHVAAASRFGAPNALLNNDHRGDHSGSRSHARSQGQQQQHIAQPAFFRPASAQSAKHVPTTSEAAGVRGVNHQRHIPRSELPAASQGPSTKTSLFGNVKMASSPPVDGQEVYYRKELLEEFMWQPETPEEEALARQFIPCPFLRELGACDKVGCVFNHSGLAKPCHRLLDGFCTFGSGCMYGHDTCGVPPDQYTDLAGWVKQESELAVKVNSLWKLKKVFV